MTQTMSIKDTRNKLADVINQVAVAGDIFVITKFGQPKAMIVPISKDTLTDTSMIKKSFGAWRKRDDLKNSKKWVADLRTKMSVRHE